MPGPRFDQTRRGAVFFDEHLPSLLRELSRLANAVERVADELAAQRGAEPRPAPEPKERPR